MRTIRSSLAPCSRSVLAAATALMVTGAHAGDTPRLKPGLWQFDRTTQADNLPAGRRFIDYLLVAPHARRCVDPNLAMRAVFARTVLGFCRLTEVKRDDGTYRISRHCGKGPPITTLIKSADESHFEQTVEGEINGVHTRDSIVAERIGPCRS